MNDITGQLTAALREIGNLSSIQALLDWDSETCMPEGGLSIRAEQVALVASLVHKRRSAESLGALLKRLESNSDRPSDHAAQTNLREARRAYDRATRIPTQLVERLSRATIIGKEAWGKARAAADFAAFAPHLGEIVDIMREMAERIGYAGEPYDALLDEYEPGMTSAEVERVFASLRRPLAEFVRQIRHAPRKPDASILHRPFPVESQRRLCRLIAERIGFDFARGRIDESKHPFCSGTGPGDVRLTTRFNGDFFSAAVFGVMHEAGHGMYEQGLPAEHVFTPAGAAVSLGIHESQSRLWENFVGRGREFWEGLYESECRPAFPDALAGVSLDAFHGAINTVQPSFIRVEADEVTYNLHIILRFEIERALVAGRLQVRDVPDAWNASMRELLGITPPDAAQGCLQDIHWSAGLLGYFPTYALGNLYAAQFFAAAHRALPGLEDDIRAGRFAPLLGWLRSNIHCHGMRYLSGELVRRVTGEELSIQPFLRYVRRKFGVIYGLPTD